MAPDRYLRVFVIYVRQDLPFVRPHGIPATICRKSNFYRPAARAKKGDIVIRIRIKVSFHCVS